MRRYLIPALLGVVCLALFMMYCRDKKEETKIPVKTETPVQQESKPVCLPHTYTVVKGDSLWKIAENEWGGRAYFWPVLSEVNNLPPSNLILIGQVITIPCLCDLPFLVKKKTPKKMIAKIQQKKLETAPPVQVAPCNPCKEIPSQATPQTEPLQAKRPPPVVKEDLKIATPQTTIPPPQPVAQQTIPPPIKTIEIAKVTLPRETPKVVETHPEIKPISSSRSLVGSAWNSFGQNPIEPGNFVNYFHIDQGLVLGSIGKFQIEPYVGFNAVKDTKGFSWNNRIQGEAGLKIVRPFSRGIIEIGGAYAAERRFNPRLPDQTKMGVIAFTNGWFGWSQPTRHSVKRKLLPGTLPGTFQWRVGNISPFERNNLIGVLRADQGFTLAKVKGVSLIPTGSFQMGFDTDKNPWNNRYSYGGGLKIAIPWKSGVLDFQGGYQCATQYAGTPTNQNRCGPGFSMNIWTGWRKKIGGE